MQTAADWLLSGLTDFKRFVRAAEQLSKRDGFLQRMDVRFKAAGAAALIVSVVFSRSAPLVFFVLAIGVLAAMASRIKPGALLLWIWVPVLAFTGFVALPALFTTPGETIARLPVLDWSIQRQGLRAALMLVARAEAATTVSVLTALTSSWATLLKALRCLRVPAIFVVILGTTYRYLFLLLETAAEMSDSRRSRSVGPLQTREKQRIANATVGVLLSKSFQVSNEVHMAMLSRGFRGEVHVLDEFHSRTADWFWLSVAFTIALLVAFT